MKKFFAIAFIAASLVACNEAEKTPEPTETQVPNQDSLNAIKTADSLAKVTADSLAKVTADSLAKVAPAAPAKTPN